MKLFLLFLFTSYFALTNAQENQNYVINNTDEIKLSFIGENCNLKQLRDQYACAFPIFVNIPLDTSYRFSYPNPCSPPMLIQNFIFQVYEESDIQIILKDSKDSIYFSLENERSNPGYYYFQIKNNFLSSEISQKALSQFENLKVVIYIKDIMYDFPLSVL